MEHKSNIGREVETIISYQDGILKTLGKAIYKGWTIPAPGECYLMGVDVGKAGIPNLFFKLKETGDIVWANEIYWMFSDQIGDEKTGETLWDLYCKNATEIKKVTYKEFREDREKQLKDIAAKKGIS